MPCYKCNNGKYKYGERGRCQFDTLSACEAAERAIHARENKKQLAAKPCADDCVDCEPCIKTKTVTSS